MNYLLIIISIKHEVPDAGISTNFKNSYYILSKLQATPSEAQIA